MMKEKVIYTANINGYDTLKALNPKFSEGWKAFYFTDNINLSVNGWEMVYVRRDENMPDVAVARKIKLLSHEYFSKAEYSIWIDATREVIQPLDNFLNFFLERDINDCGWYAQIHTKRDCLYQELYGPRVRKKVPKKTLSKLHAFYTKKKFPKKLGLPETPVIIRKHNDIVKKVNTMWWNMMYKYKAYRDQLFLPYALWKHKLHPVWVHIEDQKQFIIKKEKHLK